MECENSFTSKKERIMSALQIKNDQNRGQNDQKPSRIDRKTIENHQKSIEKHQKMIENGSKSIKNARLKHALFPLKMETLISPGAA